jgi:hypothetical protein
VEAHLLLEDDCRHERHKQGVSPTQQNGIRNIRALKPDEKDYFRKEAGEKTDGNYRPKLPLMENAKLPDFMEDLHEKKKDQSTEDRGKGGYNHRTQTRHQKLPEYVTEPEKSTRQKSEHTTLHRLTIHKLLL